MPHRYSPEKLQAEVIVGRPGCEHNVVMSGRLPNTPHPGLIGKLTLGANSGPPICIRFMTTARGSETYHIGTDQDCPQDCTAAAQAAVGLFEIMGLHQIKPEITVQEQ